MRFSLSQFLERLKLYPLLLFALCMIAGIATNDYVRLPFSTVLYSLLASTVLAVFFYKRLILNYIFTYATVFVLGALLYAYNEEKTAISGGEQRLNMEAVVVSSPAERGKVVQCELVVATGKLKGKRLLASIMRDTVSQRHSRLHIGSGVECEAYVSPLKIDSTSYARYLVSNGISGMAFVPTNHWALRSLPLSELSATDRLRLKATRYREVLLGRYRDADLSQTSVALVSAMTLGDRTMLDKPLREKFSTTGTFHVLAMSGLHLSMLYLFLTFAWGRRKRWVAVSLVNIFLIWTFVFIAGLPTSLVRSAIMLTTYCILSVSRRETQPLNTLSLAAIIIAVANPMSIYDAGFQMSFVTVLALLTLVPMLINYFAQREVSRFPAFRGCLSFIVVTCVAQIAVSPLIAYYFGRFSCYYLLANVVAIPCTYVILLAGMMFLLIPIAVVQDFIAAVLNGVIRLMDTSLTAIASLPYASINVDIGIMGVVFSYTVIAFLALLAARFVKVKPRFEQ